MEHCTELYGVHTYVLRMTYFSKVKTGNTLTLRNLQV